MKKCDPFNCKRFLKLYEKYYEKTPCDVFVEKCPYREGYGTDCTMVE